MTMVTQTRNVGKPPRAFMRRDSPTGPLYEWARYPGLQPTQRTESFRTPRIAVDPLSPEAIKEFVDVTRNGFTETSTQYDNGHDFYTTKSSYTLSHPYWVNKMNRTYDGGYQELRGPLIMEIGSLPSGVSFPPELRMETSAISSKGSAAIAATAPTKSTVSLAAFLGEMTEGLPRILGAGILESKSQLFRALGSEYLNYEFGWKPLVNDLRKLANDVLNSSRIIEQYHRDSGRVVRRKHSFPTEISESQTTEGNGMGRMWGFGNGNWNDFQSGTMYPVTIDNHIRKDIWFSGAYSYHLPTEDGLIGKLKTYCAEADRLLGVELTPDVLWQLAPWSWLVDWFVDIGSVLTTASLLSSDGLVLRYGYLMQHTRHNKTYRLSHGANFINSSKTGPVTVTTRRETKQRIKATPYGFGLSLTGLNTRQWAILGALGMTKAPRSLF